VYLDRALTVRARLVVGFVVGVLAVAGCGGGGKTDHRAADTGTAAQTTTDSALAAAQAQARAQAAARRRAAHSHQANPSSTTASPSSTGSSSNTAAMRELARKYGQAAIAFQTARQRVTPVLATRAQANELKMETGCRQMTRGAAQERGFAVAIEATVIDQDRLVLAAYRNFSTSLLAPHPSDPVLARAAQDSVAVSNQMAAAASVNDDPCSLASSWQAAGWSPRWLASVQAGNNAAASVQTRKDARAAAGRLTELGVSRVTAEQFAAALTILFSN
jgi:hypothetical protein